MCNTSDNDSINCSSNNNSNNKILNKNNTDDADHILILLIVIIIIIMLEVGLVVLSESIRLGLGFVDQIELENSIS